MVPRFQPALDVEGGYWTFAALAKGFDRTPRSGCMPPKVAQLFERIQLGCRIKRAGMIVLGKPCYVAGTIGAPDIIRKLSTENTHNTVYFTLVGAEKIPLVKNLVIIASIDVYVIFAVQLPLMKWPETRLISPASIAPKSGDLLF